MWWEGCSCIYVLRFSVFGMNYVLLEFFCILCLSLYHHSAMGKGELSKIGRDSGVLVPRRSVHHENHAKQQTRLELTMWRLMQLRYCASPSSYIAKQLLVPSSIYFSTHWTSLALSLETTRFK
jgi:hypothetical protein